MNETAYSGVYSDLTGKIINAAIEVHTELGCGLKEEAYEAALAWELSQRGYKVLRQVPCPVIYKGHVFCRNDEYPKRIDLLVEDKIVVEVKAVCTHQSVFAAQCRTYLRMLNLPSGLVLNFGFPSLKEGIDHVTNPKAMTSILQDSKTPNSDSKGDEVAFAGGSLGVLEEGDSRCGTPRLRDSRQRKQRERVAFAGGSLGVLEDGDSREGTPRLRDSSQRKQP